MFLDRNANFEYETLVKKFRMKVLILEMFLPLFKYRGILIIVVQVFSIFLFTKSIFFISTECRMLNFVFNLFKKIKFINDFDVY